MIEKDKLARTVTMLEREVKEHPRDAFHWFNLANAYSVGRRPSDAEVAARLCINFVPEGAPYAPVAYQILTSALIAQERADEALQECEVAEMKGVLTVINEFDRAHALFKLERTEEALKSIEKCLAMEWPSDLTGDAGIKTYKGAVLKSQILTRLGRATEGLALAEEAQRIDPNFGVGIYALGCALEKLGRHGQAAEAFLRASSHYGLEGCVRLAAREYAKAGNHHRAAELFGALLDHHRDAEAGSGFIRALDAIGDEPSLLEGYERLASLKLMSPAVLVNWGRTLAKLGRLDEGLQKFDQAIAKDPKYSNATLNAGDLLYGCGQYQEAAQRYEQALRADPLNAQAWFVLGNCFARLGHGQGAELAYRQTLGIDPNHREARANLDVVSAIAA
jgi:tetratricopeptide (TPR) repeat protein